MKGINAFSGLSLFFLCFASVCFAYDIQPYSRQSAAASENSLNLIFCSRHYQNRRAFLKDVGALALRLSRTRPFDEFVSDIRFYYIFLTRQEEEAVFKPADGFPPIKARRDFIDDIGEHLKSNYKVIVLDVSGGVCGAELSSMDKMSLIILGKARYKDSNSFAKGFMHELGHSLGLRDEGLSSEAAGCPPGPPNCAISEEEAKIWWGDLAGIHPRVRYIRGCCGNKSYIRPTIASLMNNPDKAEDFGPVNERYLRRIYQGREQK